MKVLLVDDSKTMRNIQKKVLEGLSGGTEFTEAGDGLEALSAIAANPAGFNIILVDWNMPNMDGLTLVTKIRENDKKTPVIMVTTEAEKTRVVDAIKAGVNNYVIKPFTPPQLLEKVSATLEKLKAAA
jgi:two-component system, chemotaxis family, chemotaxis protein CheY